MGAAETTRRHLRSGVVAALLLAALPALAVTSPQQDVFAGRTAQAQVWVDIELARYRTGESFIPLLVAFRNTGAEQVTLDRSSFSLVAADGQTIPMATVEQVRDRYPMQLFDQTAVRFTGLPLGTVLDLRDLEPSDFFPFAGDSGAEPGSQRVSLPADRWTVDLVYFQRPVGFAEGQTITMRVAGSSWRQPVTVHFHL